MSILNYMARPCFLTHIGEPLRSLRSNEHKKVLEKFPDYDYCNPENLEEIFSVLQKMVEMSVASQAVAILYIYGHGNNEEDILFTFPKLKIKAKHIYDYLAQSKKNYPSFKCVVLVETCFSGYFAKLGEELCCEALITSTDDKHVSRNNLLLSAFNEVLMESSIFTPDKIYSHAYDDDDDDKSWTQKSKTIQMASVWDLSSINEDFAKEHNLSKDNFKECFPQKFGNTDLLLKPVVSVDIMTQVVEETTAKGQILSSENLHQNLLELTKQPYSFEDFFASMTLRQFKCNCKIKPDNVIVN